MRVVIARTLHDRLVAEAAATPHVEICGLLFGTGARIEAAAAADNVATQPATRFEIDPAALFAALRAERAGGAPLIGHYHSHPNGRSTPSPCDAAQIGEWGRLWLILAGGEARLWRAVRGGAIDDAFDPVALVLE